MILISDEDFKKYQKSYIPILKNYLEQMDSSKITSDMLSIQLDYISSLLKLTLIGERNYNLYLAYANDIVSGKKCEWFLEPRSKQEIKEFCLEHCQV